MTVGRSSVMAVARATRRPDRDRGAVVVFCLEGEVPEPVQKAMIGLPSRARIGLAAQRRGFSGKRDADLLLAFADDGPAVMLVGLGATDGRDAHALRRASAVAIRRARQARLDDLVAILPSAFSDALGVRRATQALVEGALLADYDFPFYRTVEVRPRMTRLALSAPATDADEVTSGIRTGLATAGAACLARDLCNHPGSVLTPTALARTAVDLAAAAGIRARIHDEDDLRRLGMGAILAVAAGSREPPCLIELDYAPAGLETAPPLVLVGKSVTFDSGGISLKVALDMEQMKADMTGGAVVLAVMEAAARLGLRRRIVGLLPAVENMPGGRAMRPGDVLRTASGRTVEVLNTDAEGRLILADALHHALSFEPECIVDVATLTGASAIIFGSVMNGFVSTDPARAAALKAAGDFAGEPVWELPLASAYRDMLRSEVADLRNIGTAGQKGSTLVAAAFLHAFVGDAAWLHLDTYNTCWSDSDDPCLPRGPTGAGARILMQFLLDSSLERR